jgi:hypothetical protein
LEFALDRPVFQRERERERERDERKERERKEREIENTSSDAGKNSFLYTILANVIALNKDIDKNTVILRTEIGNHLLNIVL